MESIIPKGFETTTHPIFKNPYIINDRLKKYKRRYPPVPTSNVINQIVESAPSNKKFRIENDLSGVESNPGNSDQNKRWIGIEADAVSGDFEAETHKCPICLESVDDPVTIIKCTHSFCFNCIYVWFEKTMSCPLCKEEDVNFIRNINKTDASKVEVWRFICNEKKRKIDKSHRKRSIAIHQQKFL